MPWTEDDVIRAAGLGADFDRLPKDLQDLTWKWLENPANQAKFTKAQQEFAGTNYGDRMREMARQQHSPFATVDHTNIDQARQLAAQSYAQQGQALGLMRGMAQGQGPSVAALQGQANQDAAMNAMVGGGRAALMSNAMQGAGAQAAQARGQEIGQAQQGWQQGAGQMRGQSLQDYGQGLQNSQGASQLNLQQQQQDLHRRLQLEKLAMAGYRQDIMGRNQLQNQLQKFQFNQQGVNDAYTAGALNSAGSGLAQGFSSFGSSGDKARGGKSWSDWEGPKY